MSAMSGIVAGMTARVQTCPSLERDLGVVLQRLAACGLEPPDCCSHFSNALCEFAGASAVRGVDWERGAALASAAPALPALIQAYYPSILRALSEAGAPSRQVLEEASQTSEALRRLGLGPSCREAALGAACVAVEAWVEAAAACEAEGVEERDEGDDSGVDEENEEDQDTFSPLKAPSSLLRGALLFAESSPLRLLEACLGPASLSSARPLLSHLAHECVGLSRIEGLFEAIVDWPDSAPKVAELAHCLALAPGLASQLPQRLCAALRRRLLHPGAATRDVLACFVSSARLLAALSSRAGLRPGELLEGPAAGPVLRLLRAHLRARRDALGAVVDMLTDVAGEGAGGAGGQGEEGWLTLEGPNADARAVEEAVRWKPRGDWEAGEQLDGEAEEEEEDSGGEDPMQTSARDRKAPPGFPLAAPLPCVDVPALLVSVFGSPDALIKEYARSLAARLVQRSGFDTEAEERTLEMLRARFGDARLAAAMVVLRDVGDSRRIGAAIRAAWEKRQGAPDTSPALPEELPLQALSATVASRLYWPSVAEEAASKAPPLRLPAPVAAALDRYGQEYHRLKAPRRLRWAPALGVVSLELCLGDEAREFEVAPVLAAVVLAFQRQARWSLAQLSAELGWPEAALERRVGFWVAEGVLHEEAGSRARGLAFCRNEAFARAGQGGQEEEEGGADGADGAEEQTLATLEPFIIGMLTNFDALPLDRIHNMLKMFATDPPYESSLDQLSGYMKTLQLREAVAFEGGVYKRK